MDALRRTRRAITAAGTPEAQGARLQPQVPDAPGQQHVVNTTGTNNVCLRVCGTPVVTSLRTLTALPGTFFANLVDLPERTDGKEGPELSLDLDFAMGAVQALLTTLRAARTSVDLAFRAVQGGMRTCAVELPLLFDYIGLTWLLPRHLPSEFDSEASAMAVDFEYFSGDTSRVSDISGVLRFLHLSPTFTEQQQPMCAVVDERAQTLDVLELRELAVQDKAFSSGKLVYMPLIGDRQLVLDLGPGAALNPSGLVLWISPPPRNCMLHIAVSALSELTGNTCTVLRCHLHQSECDQHQSVLARLPITPSLRALYRMFRLTFEFSRRGSSRLPPPCTLLELELFGDYVERLPQEVLLGDTPRFQFDPAYADFIRRVFKPVVER